MSYHQLLHEKQKKKTKKNPGCCRCFSREMNHHPDNGDIDIRSHGIDPSTKEVPKLETMVVNITVQEN